PFTKCRVRGAVRSTKHGTLGRVDLRRSQSFDRQQDDLQNAPEPGLAINTVNGYLFSNLNHVSTLGDWLVAYDERDRFTPASGGVCVSS
ncbi:MAG TPA: hypothetical protein PKD54_11810, partial [Pirellulaceae bacterium]|nr:hypothetical protein [Pirellulaceae bacterium]